MRRRRPATPQYLIEHCPIKPGHFGPGLLAPCFRYFGAEQGNHVRQLEDIHVPILPPVAHLVKDNPTKRKRQRPAIRAPNLARSCPRQTRLRAAANPGLGSAWPNTRKSVCMLRLSYAKSWPARPRLQFHNPAPCSSPQSRVGPSQTLRKRVLTADKAET